ncbi:MAG: iron-sulfur cluster assembly accessory protein [Myxococcota bacterium]|nr:iron-sulfur cluster assembly accessory protein [Myxococcota bacterium]
MDRIDVTPAAVENIKRLQDEYEASGFGLRFGLRGGGCSGYKYVLELESDPDEGDLIFDESGIRVFVNPEHMEKLKNSVIGWKESLMESGFDIDNPQAKRPCGCGESVDF